MIESCLRFFTSLTSRCWVYGKAFGAREVLNPFRYFRSQPSLTFHLIFVEAGMQGAYSFHREGLENLSKTESLELLKSLQAITDFPLIYQDPWTWTATFNASDSGFDFKTHSPKKIRHQTIQTYLPSGPDASRWLTWMTEAQMLFHHHPINQSREAQGQRPINWIWIEKTSR